MPTHLVTVRNDLKRLVKKSTKSGNRLSILDVGGRKSPYSINISGDITLLDVPQESGTRQDLNLGFTDSILTTIQSKRSNIKEVVIEDMTQSTLPNSSYDAVICIEVIEHVEADDDFIRHISNVIKSGGWAYFTTPNGDFIKNEGVGKNPDHVRHYTRLQLKELLENYFDKVDVHYAVKTGKYRVKGLRSYSLRHPLKTMNSIASNVINRFQSINIDQTAHGTAHLVAIVYNE
jgi:SAM-dependent methyltransferase